MPLTSPSRYRFAAIRTDRIITARRHTDVCQPLRSMSHGDRFCTPIPPAHKLLTAPAMRMPRAGWKTVGHRASQTSNKTCKPHQIQQHILEEQQQGMIAPTQCKYAMVLGSGTAGRQHARWKL